MHRVWRSLTVVVAVLACFYIWHFSLADGERSAITSGKAMEWINGVLARLGVDYQFNHQTVRKIGHFVGYLILGFLSALAVWGVKIDGYPVVALSLCLAVAAVDEGLQLFSPGRVASVADVLLDGAGAACGILLFSIPVSALSILFKNKVKKVEK